MSGGGKGILKNTAIVGAMTALSRVLGLVREMFQSRLIGAGVEQSAFTLAFAIPNMMRKLFGEGALTAAFVPVFKGEVEALRMESARQLVGGTRLSFKEISDRLGFAAPAHFSAAFHESVGCTLKEYRKRAAEKRSRWTVGSMSSL